MVDKQDLNILLKFLGYKKRFKHYVKTYIPDDEQNNIKITQRLKVNLKTKSVLASLKNHSVIYSHYNIKDIAIALNRTVSDAKMITKRIRSKTKNESVSDKTTTNQN